MSKCEKCDHNMEYAEQYRAAVVQLHDAIDKFQEALRENPKQPWSPEWYDLIAAYEDTIDVAESAALAKNPATAIPGAQPAECARYMPGTSGEPDGGPPVAPLTVSRSDLLNPSDTDGPLYRSIRYLSALQVMRTTHSGVVDSVGGMELTVADLQAVTDRLIALYRSAEDCPRVVPCSEDSRIAFIRNQAAKAIPQPHHHGEAPPPTWDQIRVLLAEVDRLNGKPEEDSL